MRGGSNASTVRHKSREGLSNERGEPSALVNTSSLSPDLANLLRSRYSFAPSAGSEIAPCRRRLRSHHGLPHRLVLSPGTAALRQCDAERLEDRLEDVMRVRAVEQTDVQRQRRAVRELAQERGDDVGRDPAETRLRQVDVRHQQRLVARLERDVCKGLGGRDDRRAVASDGVLPQRCGKRLAGTNRLPARSPGRPRP